MKFRQLMEEYKYKSDILRKAVEKANSNGAGLENDGTKYIIGGFDRYFPDKTKAMSSAIDKKTANDIVKQFKTNNDISLIIVQKGNDIVSYRRHESGKWEMRK